MSFMELTVTRIEAAAVDIRVFRLSAPDGRELPLFTPGAHVDVTTPSGKVRQYSLCTAAIPHEYVIAVKRERQSRGGSASMHAEVTSGMTLRVGAPRNNFELAPDEPEVILLAGGIGMTPLLCMAERLLQEGRRFRLHYFARSSEHAVFRELLSKPHWNDRVSFHFGLDVPSTEAALFAATKQCGEETGIYICGPAPFMEAAQRQASVVGARRMHLEHFAPPPALTSFEDRPFTVVLMKTGERLEVPCDKSIVSAMTEQGLYPDVLCEQGVCGTCITRVLGGTPDHRDLYLTDEEKAAGTHMMICVSRSKGPVIELDL